MGKGQSREEGREISFPPRPAPPVIGLRRSLCFGFRNQCPGTDCESLTGPPAPRLIPCLREGCQIVSCAFQVEPGLAAVLQLYKNCRPLSARASGRGEHGKIAG